MKKWNLSLFFMLAAFCGSAQKLILEGFYKSQNFYIQNPDLCTEKLYVNGVKTQFEKASVFMIRLDTLGLKSGDPVKIEIYHGSGCKPRIITENDYPKKRLFDIVSIAIDEKGILHWTTKGETSKLPFIIEQYRWNKWIKVSEKEALNGSAENEYSQVLPFHNGKNKFRIKQISELGQISLSAAVEFSSDAPKITLLNARGKIYKEINFSGETMFEVYDSNGYIIKKGTAKTIDCSEFPKGSYYLNFDNQMAELTKLP